MTNKTKDGKSGGTVHVVPTETGWAVKRGGSSAPLSNHRTKATAVQVGRTESRAAKAELVIHNRNGRIGRSDSHGNDPRSIKG